MIRLLLILLIYIKHNTIRNPTSLLDFDPDTLFTIVLMEVDKCGQLKPRQVRERIASITLDKFFDCLCYMEEDSV